MENRTEWYKITYFNGKNVHTCLRSGKNIFQVIEDFKNESSVEIDVYKVENSVALSTYRLTRK